MHTYVEWANCEQCARLYQDHDCLERQGRHGPGRGLKRSFNSYGNAWFPGDSMTQFAWGCWVYICYPSIISNSSPFMNNDGLPWWLRWYRICRQCRRPGFSPRVGKIPWRRTWQSLQYSCLEDPHGAWSLEGCSPWGCKESDMTEQLSTAQHEQ